MPWNPPTTRSTNFLMTAAVYDSDVVDNLNFLAEVKYSGFTSDKSITATTVGTAQEIVTASAITYENVPHLIEFYCPAYNAPAQETRIIVRDGTTVLGTLARVGASAVTAPIYLMYRVTPTAASHTYNIAGWLGGAGTGTMNAGTGGATGDATTDVAGFIRITRVPT